MNISINKKSVLLIALLVVLVCAAGYYAYSRQKALRESSSPLGQAFADNASSTRFVSPTGREVSMSEFVGNKLYVNSWASWSPLSRDELILLNEVAGEYKDRGITFIALNRKETLPAAERYLATLPALPNLVIVIDNDDHFYQNTGGYAMPETLLYTESGDVFAHERIPLNRDQMVANIEALLQAE
jgi:thiol-disulfide isomerase/thioredoxin